MTIYSIRAYAQDAGLDFEELRDYLACYCKASFLESLSIKYETWPKYRNKWYREFLENARNEVLNSYE